MAKKIRIFVACGSGIATSSVACDTIKELCAKEGIDVFIDKGALSEIPAKQENCDIILTTAKYRGEASVPILPITSFITGIGQKKTEDTLISMLHEIDS